ncbi:MAG: stage II sporulation protein D [Bacillota bacterium]|nr:stage II sporulation protein D [Bacillota bacterium]
MGGLSWKGAWKQWRRAGWAALLFGLLSGFLLGFSRCAPEELPEESLLMIRVQWPDGSCSPVALEEFLAGVLAAEMPASFQPQALQAQAVAARSYILRQQDSGKHGEAAVCCDSQCCQAWLSRESLEQRWGADFPAHWQKIRDAVAATAGQVLLYRGEIIDALFCSTCGGMTEEVSAVWGGERPYLPAHPCPYCRHSSRYSGVKRYTFAEAASRLGLQPEQIPEMELLSTTAGGRVALLACGGRQYKGTELRSLLELDSAAFSWLLQGKEIVLLSLGYGHGVGLCQWGADGMARAGHGCWEILSFYYPGAEPGLAGDFL